MWSFKFHYSSQVRDVVDEIKQPQVFNLNLHSVPTSTVKWIVFKVWLTSIENVFLQSCFLNYWFCSLVKKYVCLFSRVLSFPHNQVNTFTADIIDLYNSTVRSLNLVAIGKYCIPLFVIWYLVEALSLSITL